MTISKIRLALVIFNFAIWALVVYALCHPPRHVDPLGQVQGRYSQLDCHSQPGTHPQYVNVDGHPFFLACGVSTKDDDAPLPLELPQSATAAETCNVNQPGVHKVLVVVVTYPSGQVLRFDAHHMHGLKSAQELMEYAESAPDKRVYSTGCDGVDT